MVQRPNYGILFQPVGRMQATYNKWSHTFQLAMPNRLQLSNINATCLKPTSRHPCSALAKALQRAHAIRMSTAATLNSLRDQTIALIPNRGVQSPLSRSKRSILPIIGEISHALFGTATEQEVETLAKHIVALEKHSQKQAVAFARHAEEMSSFMSATSKHFESLSSEIFANHEALSDVSFTLHSYGLAIDATIKMSIALAEQVHLTSRLQEQFSLLFQGVHELTQHRLSPALLPLQVVKQTLQNIANSLASSHPQFQVAINANQLYNSNDFIWTFRNNSIFITVNVPLLTQAVVLNVFKVLSVPVPLHHSSSHVTQLLDAPRYIALSSDGLYYTTPDPDKWLSCTRRQNGKLCQLDTPLIQSSTPSCLTAIYNQQLATVKKLCDFRFLEHALPVSVINIQPGTFLMSNISHLTLTCQSEVRTTPGCNYCIMNIPCLCAVSAGHYYIPPHLQNCGKATSTTITRLHPINLALLLHFKQLDSINHLNGDSLFPHPVDIPTPNFKLYNHSFTKMVAQNLKEDLSLKHMVAKAKADEVIYRNLAEPVLEDISNNPSSILWLTSNWWWTLIPIIVSALSLAATILLYCKFRTLSAYVAVISQVKTVTALPAKKIIDLFPSSTQSTNPTPEPVDICTHAVASYMVAFAILLTVVFLLYRAYKRNKHHTTIFLELSTGPKCVKIPITDIPICPRNFHFQASQWLQNINITESLSPKLNVDWQDLSITNTLSNQEISLPDKLPISLWQALKLHYLLKEKFHALLFVRHSQFSFYVQVCHKPCTQCVPILTGTLSHHYD